LYHLEVGSLSLAGCAGLTGPAWQDLS